MSQHPNTTKSPKLLRFCVFYVTLHFCSFKTIFSKKKKKSVHLTEDIRQAITGPGRNRWSMLRASSSRPHVPIPPNLISEALFPVAQMALRTPKTIHLRRIKNPRPHLASSGRVAEEAYRMGGNCGLAKGESER